MARRINKQINKRYSNIITATKVASCVRCLIKVNKKVNKIWSLFTTCEDTNKLPLNSEFLRSSTQILLQVPVSRRRCYADCAFNVAGPCLWNRLPETIKCATSSEETSVYDCLPRSVIFSLWFYRTVPLNSFDSNGALVKLLLLLLLLLISCLSITSYHILFIPSFQNVVYPFSSNSASPILALPITQ